MPNKFKALKGLFLFDEPAFQQAQCVNKLFGIINIISTQCISRNQTSLARLQCKKRCFVISLSPTHQTQFKGTSGGRAFLLLRLVRVGILSSNIFHENAITLEGAGLFHNWWNTLLSSSPQVSSKINNPSNFLYMDFTVKTPSASPFHTQLSFSWFHTWPSKSSNNAFKRCSSQTKKSTTPSM